MEASSYDGLRRPLLAIFRAGGIEGKGLLCLMELLRGAASATANGAAYEIAVDVEDVVGWCCDTSWFEW